MFRRPPSLRRVVFDGDCPGFVGTTQTLRLPAIPPAALRLPSLGGTTVAPVALLPRDHRRDIAGPGCLLNAATQTPPIKSVELTGSPKFPRNPLAATHMLLRPRRNQTELAVTLRPTRLRLRERPQLPRTLFRGSITWLGGSLSTLRSGGLLRCHARLACGCRLNSAARDSHPPGFTERFQLCFQHHIASSSRELPWRNPL